jgi:hypothetical protein
MPQVNYRVGDKIKIRAVSLQDEGDFVTKINIPEDFRGLEGTVVQVRPFVENPGFYPTIAVELEYNGVVDTFATEPVHLRLLKRGPKVDERPSE